MFSSNFSYKNCRKTLSKFSIIRAIPMSKAYPFVYEARREKWDTYQGIENGAAMPYLNLRYVGYI